MDTKIFFSTKILLISCFIFLSGYGPLMAGEDTAVLKAMIGAVDYFAKDSTAWQPAKEGLQLSSGDKIRTGADGMASVSFANGSQIMLKPNTEFEVTSLSRSEDKNSIDYKLQLNMGKLRAMVEKLDSNSSFEIKTPTAVAAIRGTVYYLEVRELKPEEVSEEIKDKLVTELFVEVGGVIYTNTASGRYFAVSAGQESNSYGDGNIDSPVDVPEDKQLEWTEGWDAILNAEPYQEPGGGDPDFGFGDQTGEDGENTTRQGEQGGAVDEDLIEDARLASEAAAEAAIRAEEASDSALNALADVDGSVIDLNTAKDNMEAAYNGEGGAYAAILEARGEYDDAFKLVSDVQYEIDDVIAGEPEDPFNDPFGGNIIELPEDFELPDGFEVPDNIEDWQFFVRLTEYWGFSLEELDSENIDSFSSFLLVLSDKMGEKLDGLTAQLNTQNEDNEEIAGLLRNASNDASARAAELEALAARLQEAADEAFITGNDAALEAVQVLIELTQAAINEANLATGAANDAALVAEEAIEEARVKIEQAGILVSAMGVIIDDVALLEAAFNAVATDSEDFATNTTDLRDAIIASVEAREAASRAYAASGNAQDALGEINTKSGVMDTTESDVNAAYDMASASLGEAKDEYSNAKKKAGAAQFAINGAIGDVNFEDAKNRGYVIVDIPAARNKIDTYQAQLNNISSDICTLKHTLNALSQQLSGKDSSSIASRLQQSMDDASFWAGTANTLSDEIREVAANAENGGDDAVLAILYILVEFTREAIDNANTAAAAANTAAEEAETVLAGTPELLSQADTIIGALNDIKSELDTMTDTQLADAIAAAEELLNNAQSIVENEILGDIVAYEAQREKGVIRDKMYAILERQYLREAIRDILDDAELRQVDGYLEKISDAQIGKVMKDIHGNRVRVEQYILRPSSDTVELLNVNLRAGNDLTTLSWATTFNRPLDTLKTGQLKDLPWNDYLDTHYNDDGVPAYINSPYEQHGIYPTAMSTTVAHTVAHVSDFFTESKNFGERDGWWLWGWQSIYDQTLLVHNFNNDVAMSYAKQVYNHHTHTYNQPDSTYSITSGLENANIGGANHNPEGFRFNIASVGGVSNSINAAFYVISDAGERRDKGSVNIHDLGDALRVNMGTDSLNIGNNKYGNNLEMIFTSSAFQDAGGIDLIYVPTNRMDWKPDNNVPNYSLPQLSPNN